MYCYQGVPRSEGALASGPVPGELAGGTIPSVIYTYPGEGLPGEPNCPTVGRVMKEPACGRVKVVRRARVGGSPLVSRLHAYPSAW